VARDFAPPAPNLTWVGDVTYIKTWAGWAFCATVIDCYSRKVVGFALADTGTAKSGLRYSCRRQPESFEDAAAFACVVS